MSGTTPHPSEGDGTVAKIVVDVTNPGADKHMESGCNFLILVILLSVVVVGILMLIL